jgi:ethanolamine utilization protein EutA
VTDHDHDHDHDAAGEDAAIARTIREQETLKLLTVGIDIGSSTSHLLFARVLLRRQSEDLSSRFVVVERTVLWRSPIRLTPFVADGTIDADALEEFVQQCYRDAGIKRDDVDSGAVILTGEAIKRQNARAIDELFASRSGTFVCATAGHKLEAILAAHGSGATALSRARQACGLHVDIGGGTAKLALIDHGQVLAVSAVAVGGRAVAKDDSGAWTRVDEAAEVVARAIGVETSPGALADDATRQALATRLAELLVDEILGTEPDDLGRRLALTEPLHRTVAPSYLTFSGGVAEYLVDGETEDHGDLARLLATELSRALRARTTLRIIEVPQRIRATVIGASQFTVQVSGKTVHVSGDHALPARNVPVVHVGTSLPDPVEQATGVASVRASLDLHERDPAAALALAFTWSAEPEYSQLQAMSRAIVEATTTDGRRDALLVLVIDGDVGQTIGRLLVQECGLQSDLVVVDGVRLTDLDFIDIGEVMQPPGVIPVVIKSLLFA